MSDLSTDDVAAAASSAAEKAQAAYDKGLERAQSAAADIEAYARAKPWMALGAALGTGLLVGHFTGRAGQKVVFVRKVKSSEVA